MVDSDMDDREILAAATTPARFAAALQWLETNLLPSYRLADQKAKMFRRHHRILAVYCITAGTGAIILAILQLALQQAFRPLTTVAMVAEIVVILFAAAAVAFGLKARRNHGWIIQRHRAERLRSLKFESLAQPKLLQGDLEAWQSWVRAQLAEIHRQQTLEQVVQWSSSLGVEPELTSIENLPSDSKLASNIAAYYVAKRVAHQARYFTQRRDDCHRQAGHWPHRGAWFFFGSVTCVLLHVGIDVWILQHPEPGNSHTAMHTLAVSLLSLAAILPVAGFGVRAWFTAFELPRSASLYGSKAKALNDTSQRILERSDDPATVLRHIAHTEHFLQHEHGEWIRLIRDTEWFL